MLETKREITIYSVGKKEFLSKEEAQAYEDKVKEELNYIYCIVLHNPDDNEGRGFYKSTKLAAHADSCPNQTIMEYCVREFGNPLAFIQGVSPIPNWVINREYKFDTLEELEEFKIMYVNDGIGDYRKPVQKDIVYLTRKGVIDEKKTVE